MSEPTPDDAELVAAAQQGDRAAFGALVERYQDRSYNTLVRVLGSRHDAADVLQDAFVQAYTKLGSFRGEAKFSTWFYRVAMNLALSHRRRRRPAASIDELKTNMGEEPIDRQRGPESRTIAAEQTQLVQRALERLGDEPRQILVLRELEEYSYHQISEILELPVGTVRSRLFRARVQLKERLEELMGE